MFLLVSFHVCEAKKKSRSSEVVLSCLEETLVVVHIGIYLRFFLELCSAIVTMLLLHYIYFIHLYTHRAAHVFLHIYIMVLQFTGYWKNAV